MLKVSNALIREAKAVIRFYLFLRYDYWLKEANELSAKEVVVCGVGVLRGFS